MDFSFLDLRCKEVINVVDGKRLGHICDVIMDLSCGIVQGFTVPGSKAIWNIFKSNQEIYIPLNQVCKIGTDAILVEIYGVTTPPTCDLCQNNNLPPLQSPK